MTPAEARALHEIARLRAERARAQMRALASRADALRAGADALGGEPSEPPASAAEALALERWRRWSGARRAALLEQLALVEAERAELRRGHSRALGREAVAGELVRRAEAARRRE